MGDENAVGLCTALNPTAVVPLVNAEFDQDGPLAAAIQQVGTADSLQARLAAAGLAARVLDPAPPGQALEVVL